MSDITLPGRLDGRRAGQEHPHAGLARLHVHRRATSRAAFLSGVAEKKLLGQRCPVCTKVYVPARGCCPTDGVRHRAKRSSWPHDGTVTTFCVVNVPFYGQAMELPYVSALILLDGSDIPLMHLIQETDADDVHMGHAGRGGVGARRGDRPDPRDRSSTSDRPASPTPTGTPTRTTSDARHRDHLARSDRPHPPALRRQRGRDADAGAGRGARRRRHHQGPASTSSAPAAPTTWPARPSRSS